MLKANHIKEIGVIKLRHNPLVGCKRRDDAKMKKLILTIITLFSLLTVFAQNGLNNGNLFLLQKDKKTISINSFENNKLVELKSFSISEKSIFTTDQRSKVAILDTTKNDVTIFDIHSSNQIKPPIPFDIKPKTVLLNNDNLFVGGEMGKEILIQYHLQNEKWHQLEAPKEVVLFGKAIDDLVVNDSLLIAIDNIIMPKYILFYRLNTNGKLEFSHYKGLKHNGAYESIHQGRITETYIGLLSDTYSGYVGATNHITIYDNIEFTNSFVLSSNQKDKDYHTFTDFLIVKDKIIIASKEKGLGIFEIRNTYFKKSDKYGNNDSNPRESTSKIKYSKYDNQVVIKLTLIPNTTKIIVTLENKRGVFTHEIIEI